MNPDYRTIVASRLPFSRKALAAVCAAVSAGHTADCSSVEGLARWPAYIAAQTAASALRLGSRQRWQDNSLSPRSPGQRCADGQTALRRFSLEQVRALAEEFLRARLPGGGSTSGLMKRRSTGNLTLP